MTTKSDHWYYFVPGWNMGFAYDLRTRFPITKDEARQIIREHWGLKRLPCGTEIWR